MGHRAQDIIGEFADFGAHGDGFVGQPDVIVQVIGLADRVVLRRFNLVICVWFMFPDRSRHSVGVVLISSKLADMT